MSNVQVLTPNLNITYTGGFCLAAVENAFGVAHHYPTAMAAWLAGANGHGNHDGQPPPAGVAVPVFFALGSEPAGHIAIALPDGRVASSTQPGTHVGLFIHPTLSNLIAIYAAANKGCTYLGWSERLADTVVVTTQGGNDMTLDQKKEIVRSIYRVLGDGFMAGEDVITDKANQIGDDGNIDVPATDVRNSIPWIDPAAFNQKMTDATAPIQAQLNDAQFALKACQDAAAAPADPVTTNCQQQADQAVQIALEKADAAKYQTDPISYLFAWLSHRKVGDSSK